MVVEGRRDESRPDVQQAEHVSIRGRPRVLTARDEPIADGDLARANARSSVHLALAPPALACVAHQPARSMEAEAPRQDRPPGGEHRYGEWLALERFDRSAVDVDADPAPRGERRRVRMGR